MIPGNAFLGQAPEAGVPVYLLPKKVILSYNEGAQDFIPAAHVPPLTLVALLKGQFEAEIVSGYGTSFGLRAELRRTGVYGSALIDSLHFNIAAIQLAVEYCPDVTNETIETSVPTTLTSEEACPHVTVPIEETSMPISAISSDV